MRKIFIPALVFGLRLFQGGCVVHAVSRHGHNVADAVVAVFLVGLSAGFCVENPFSGGHLDFREGGMIIYSRLLPTKLYFGG